jgi:cation diffusion facilitator CzcD-associated flavoprotein CzcO
VQLVKPVPGPAGETWEVTYKNLTNCVSDTREYDYLFICNGHYNTPFIPTIPGLKEFEGNSKILRKLYGNKSRCELKLS